MNVLEDEYHFLLVCPKYRHLRQNYFSKYFCHWPNIHKCTSLMSEQNKSEINNLGKFVYYANNIRV